MFIIKIILFIFVQGGFGGSLSKMNVKVQINHDGEVHRARYMPQEPVRYQIQ